MEVCVVDTSAWLAILLPNVVILAVGAIVLCCAGRWPRVMVGLIVVAVVAAVAGIWGGAELALSDFDTGSRLFTVGLMTLILGLPAWWLVGIGRLRKDATLSWGGLVDCVRMVLAFLDDPSWKLVPSDRAQEWIAWAGVVMGYWVCCWAFAFFIGIIAFFAGTPNGQFR
jgi:hypothetical protein